MTQSAYFDRSGKLLPPPRRRLLREIASLASYFPAPPKPVAECGKGQVVLVVPAFLTGDGATAPLRDYLARCGFRPFGWGAGINFGPTRSKLAALRRRLAELRAIEGGPVSLVGVSLGGLLARDLALACPADVRQVVTIVSPFRLPTASTIEPLVHLAALFFDPSIEPARLRGPLPVPATAIYTVDDGIVAWESCMGEDEGCRNIAVSGAHLTICRNPAVLDALARCLGEATG